MHSAPPRLAHLAACLLVSGLAGLNHAGATGSGDTRCSAALPGANGPASPAPTSAAQRAVDDTSGWSRVIIGAKIISVGAPEWDGAPHRSGLGLLLEMPTALAHVEVELAAAFLTGSSGAEVPFDMLFKYAFHLDATTDLFIGAGPMVAWLPGHGMGGGLIGSLGGYRWLSPTWGMLVEVDYTIFGEGPVAGHALEVAAGVVWRPAHGVK